MAQKFKIGILCQYEFPVGMAATTRIISYGTGLIQNGAEVEVYSYYWRGDDTDVPLEGKIGEIKYVLPCRYHTKRGKICHNFIDKPNIYFGTVRRIKESHKTRPFDYFLISFDKIKDYRFFLPRIERMGIPMAFIGDEFPGPIRMLKDRIPAIDIIRYKFYHRFFRKRILMTKALEDYYNQEISPKPTLLLNSVLDETRFEGIKRQDVDRKYICYMGNMQLKKDNVDNIIRAFSLIASDFPDYDLYLYGSPFPEDLEYVRKCISESGTTDRIFIKGRITYDQVPQVLANASVLVASQPDTVRAKGGFPTKMGEYMMSHTPMLLTDVGEISMYVKDEVNAFLVPPCDHIAYAGKLRFILEHPDIAGQVAEEAYNCAINNYTARNVTKDMIPFLKS